MIRGEAATCTCTTWGTCPVCRPPCQWVTHHLGEIPVRCGDDYFATVGTLPVCCDHFQFVQIHRVPGEADVETFAPTPLRRPARSPV